MTVVEKVQSKVPQLRFPEFKNEQAYEPYLFEDMFVFSSGKNIKQDEASPKYETPCVRYGELYHLYDEVITKTINKTNLDRSELTFSKGNEILLPSAGEDSLDIGSASALTIKNVAIGRTINVLRPKGEIAYSHIYMSYYINKRLRRKISTLARGASISNVYNSDLKMLKSNLPKIEEQNKVALIATTVDKKISLLKQKHEQLVQYKKGIMQQLFSQQLRFKDDNGQDFPDWEVKPVSSIMKESRVKGSAGDVARKITVKLWGRGVFEKVGKDGSENTQYYTRTAGQFIYSKLDFLNCAFGIVPEELDGLESTVDLPCFDMSEKVNKTFVLEYIKQKRFYKKYGDMADGSRKAKRIHADTFLSFPISLPSEDEQNKIADFLDAIDQKVNLAQQQIEQTQTYKQGLLQQMFV